MVRLMLVLAPVMCIIGGIAVNGIEKRLIWNFAFSITFWIHEECWRPFAIWQTEPNQERQGKAEQLSFQSWSKFISHQTVCWFLQIVSNFAFRLPLLLFLVFFVCRPPTSHIAHGWQARPIAALRLYLARDEDLCLMIIVRHTLGFEKILQRYFGDWCMSVVKIFLGCSNHVLVGLWLSNYGYGKSHCLSRQ